MEELKEYSWSKGIGYGATIWAIMTFMVWPYASFGFRNSPFFTPSILIAAGVLSYLAVKSITRYRQVLNFFYGLTFAAVGLVLDFLVGRQFSNSIFTTGTYWLSYLIIIVAPKLILKHKETGIPDVKRHQSVTH